ncbi:hypothetical protein ACFVS2_26105 [Brevibacillus sp. NPDC058079]|uniref:hypothetical protein n=1 Tax=Brevibacillus sp. NPDC058079 TaxID=3346330 RepID=UPI0036E07069
MSRLSVKVVGSFLGNCLVITDSHSKKYIEIMAVQLKGIMGGSRTSGSLPHGGYEVDGENITIYHDENRAQHEVTFTMKELEEALNCKS